jgi:hypothetical protein
MLEMWRRWEGEAMTGPTCPFGEWKPGDPGGIGICHLGVPGCGCADEFMLNPYLQEEFDDGTKRKEDQ